MKYHRIFSLIFFVLFFFDCSTYVYASEYTYDILFSYQDDLEHSLISYIANATSTIDIAIYEFDRSSIFDALVQAHNSGVDIRIVTDNDVDMAQYQALESIGIAVIDDGRSSTMHNKFFVFDQSITWTGSTNITDTGFERNYNNAIVITSTELATIYTSEFDQMYAGNFGTDKQNVVITRTLGAEFEVYFSPKDGGSYDEERVIREIVEEIESAESSIYFAMFFLTSDWIRDALIDATERGVIVQGLWDNLGASNNYSDDEALCGAGIPIMIESEIGKMHHKFAIIDVDGSDPRVITGSANWSASGGRSNDENTLIIHNTEIADAYLSGWLYMRDSIQFGETCNLVTTSVRGINVSVKSKETINVLGVLLLIVPLVGLMKNPQSID